LLAVSLKIEPLTNLDMNLVVMIYNQVLQNKCSGLWFNLVEILLNSMAKEGASPHTLAKLTLGRGGRYIYTFSNKVLQSTEPLMVSHFSHAWLGSVECHKTKLIPLDQVWGGLYIIKNCWANKRVLYHIPD
jgi:hypothetical protein